MGSLTPPQHQKAGAIAHRIIDGIGQLLEVMLLARLLGGNGRTKATARHHPGRIGRGTGGQLQGIGQVVAQPLAALGKGLGWDSTSLIPSKGPLPSNACRIGKTRARVTARSPCSQRASIQAVTPPSTEFSTGTTAASARPQARACTTARIPSWGNNSAPKTLQLHQMAGRLLAIGAHRTEIGNTHGSFEEATRPKQADKIMPRQPADDVPGFQRQSAIAT